MPICRDVIAVVGAGSVGSVTAWWLARCGAQVVWIAPPQGHGAGPGQPGSLAALGVLMGHCSRRLRGRNWRLRRTAIALWRQWLPLLGPIPQQWGLTVLCHQPDEVERLQTLVRHRQGEGCPLAWRTRDELLNCWPALAATDLQGGLWSPQDGQMDPAPLLAALAGAAERLGVQRWPAQVTGLKPDGRNWRLQLQAGDPDVPTTLPASAVALCTGLGAGPLLAALDPAIQLNWPMMPVLGQAAELHCPMLPPQGLPGPVVWRGVHLIPRPQRRQLWMGATVEPGDQSRAHCLDQMLRLDGAAPPWLRQAQVLRRWQGVRARPVGRPAPVLATPAPGLLLTSGHYRNGILLAPATAAWTAQKLGFPPPDARSGRPGNGSGQWIID
ncbi:MAG: FAD-binding oxidoreductase [Synechococcus sp. SB0673_bin_10]|uniref:FAD-binding oxidoreductase n=1 Tax=Synechococcus sp. SB0676_bin_10 TaxID=2604869 RepID=A0A6B1FCF8_9SYNE|nr:FAD-dependent oxidoreductase [Cyanobacteria bacterium MAG IRC3_bin_20]MDE0647041.1 FAD-dependent oxidoreductase [Cyanobacteria bacterium MAG IRC4_bin_6]MXX09121.1 FAD-binding oxidoreductase [Synechococcus sp. SB0667_bin_8]MXY19400.1 FAD-binding oxidoreductase [Synechococcus sp. SB0664_bin_36]MYG38944.1 FAD-binding oxidoreductase [Synechococcus sp. SB0676_bin_10]MYI71673.1 FAD-binding oxidoreductase [Synechococcus sp. SB0673_bin_10]